MEDLAKEDWSWKKPDGFSYRKVMENRRKRRAEGGGGGGGGGEREGGGGGGGGEGGRDDGDDGSIFFSGVDAIDFTLSRSLIQGSVPTHTHSLSLHEAIHAVPTHTYT